MDHKMFIIVVVAIYFVVLLGIGFFTRNKNNEVDDFLVAGRNVGLVVGGFSIASVQIGAGIIVGGATDGSQFGVWPGMYYAIGCGLGCIIAGIFIAGRMREVEGVVPMDYFHYGWYSDCSDCSTGDIEQQWCAGWRSFCNSIHSRWTV